MPSIHLYESNFLEIVESYVVGHYRGEDSGAIYPEFEYRAIKRYNLDSIKDHLIGSKTIEQLINESCREYPYAGEMFTSPQAWKIYYYIQTLPQLEKLEMKV